MAHYLDLFAGIGGLSLALEALGYEPAAFVEWDESCQRVLARHWPGVPIFGDIRTFTSDALAQPVTLVCGGFPCQDLSEAGKRSGFKGDRSSLFYELARVVAEVGPRFVLLENVRGLLTAVGSHSDKRGSAMAEVTGTLADLGFTRLDWIMLGASSVGAPHRRHRIFALASHTDDQRLEGLAGNVVGEREPRRVAQGSDGPATSAPVRAEGEAAFDWGAYEPAIRRWEAVMGPAPHPVDEANKLSPDLVTWLMGFPAGWNEGESRTNRLKQLGNAVVWQQAYRALELLTARR